MLIANSYIINAIYVYNYSFKEVKELTLDPSCVSGFSFRAKGELFASVSSGQGDLLLRMWEGVQGTMPESVQVLGTVCRVCSPQQKDGSVPQHLPLSRIVMMSQLL